RLDADRRAGRDARAVRGLGARTARAGGRADRAGRGARPRHLPEQHLRQLPHRARPRPGAESRTRSDASGLAADPRRRRAAEHARRPAPLAARRPGGQARRADALLLRHGRGGPRRAGCLPGDAEVIAAGAHERAVPAPGRLLHWVTTVDHKEIGLLYLVTTLLFFGVGGVEALLIRLQLATPRAELIGPTTYNAMFTM